MSAAQQDCGTRAPTMHKAGMRRGWGTGLLGMYVPALCYSSSAESAAVSQLVLAGIAQ